MVDKVGGVEFDVTIDSTGAVAAGSRLVENNKSISDSFDKIDKEAKKFEGSMKGLTSQYSRSSSELKEFISQQLSAGRTIDENGNVITAYGVKARNLSEQLSALTDEFKKNESRVKSVDDAYSALTKEQKVLEVAINEVNEELKENVAVQAASEKSTKNLAVSSKGASKAIGGMGRNVGMAGVQIGQFAGQIQGGQSALLAFSQQGADIGMLFGPAGMIAGGIIAVGAALAGSLMPGLMDSTDATKELADKLRDLQKENKLTEAQTKFLADQEVIANKIKEDRIKEIKKEIKETETLIKRTEAQAESLGRMGKAAQMRIDSGEIEVAESRVNALNAEMDVLQGKTGGDSDAVALAAQRAKESAESRIEILKKSLEAENELLSANAQNRKNIEKGIVSAAEAAAMEGDIAKRGRLDLAHDVLIQSLDREKQAILDSETIKAEEKAALVKSYNDLESQAKKNHDKNIEKQGKDHAAAMIKIKEMEESAKRKAVAGAFGDLSQLMNTESRKLFEIGKAAALASAVVSGYDAAVTNYKKGSDIGGPPVGAAFAAASLAATFAQVRAIQSTSFGGSGSGQSIQGGQVSNNVNGGGVGPQQNNQDISISVTGGDDAGRSILNLVNMTIANGGKIGGG